MLEGRLTSKTPGSRAVQDLLVEVGEGSLLVTEVLLIQNAGDRTFVGARPVDPQRRATLQLGAGLAYPLIRRRRRPRQAMPTSQEVLEARYGELIEAIARLDDAFEADELQQEEYKRLRAEKKTALLEVAEGLKGLQRGG